MKMLIVLITAKGGSESVDKLLIRFCIIGLTS